MDESKGPCYLARPMRLVRAALLVAVTGCASAPTRGGVTGPAPSTLPAEPLHITVVYPDTAVPIEAHDSSFLFGNVGHPRGDVDRKSTRLNSSHPSISYAV